MPFGAKLGFWARHRLPVCEELCSHGRCRRYAEPSCTDGRSANLQMVRRHPHAATGTLIIRSSFGGGQSHAADTLPADDSRRLNVEPCPREMKIDVADGRLRVPYHNFVRCPCKQSSDDRILSIVIRGHANPIAHA